MRDGKMLGQSTEIGVLAWLPCEEGLLGDCIGARELVSPQGELVEELPNGPMEVLARASALSNHRKRLSQAPRGRGMRGEPVGARRKSLRHRQEIVGTSPENAARL
jgi:hypothetical protein